MEQLPCVNRPIIHHLGLSGHCLWRGAKAQARRPRPSLAPLLAAGLPLACINISHATSPTLRSCAMLGPRHILTTTAPHLALVLLCRPHHSPHGQIPPACARGRRRIARPWPGCQRGVGQHSTLSTRHACGQASGTVGGRMGCAAGPGLSRSVSLVSSSQVSPGYSSGAQIGLWSGGLLRARAVFACMGCYGARCHQGRFSLDEAAWPRPRPR